MPSYALGRRYYPFRACWRTICEDARFGSLRLHDLSRMAVSHAVMLGENLPLVGKLLGRQHYHTPAGYAHLAHGYLVEAAEKVGNIISQAMGCAAPTATVLQEARDP